MPAQSLEASLSKGLALHVLEDGTMRTFVLYDAKKAIDELDEKGGNTTFNQVIQAIEESIEATLSCDKPDRGRAWGAMEVSTSAANKGYGPLIYDIAMLSTKGLIPDREQVSQAARRVYSKYFHERPDVEKKPLDDIDVPVTPPQIDDADLQWNDASRDSFMNHAYSMNSSSKRSQIMLLMRNDNAFLDEIKLVSVVSPERLEKAFDLASLSFFEMRYDG